MLLLTVAVPALLSALSLVPSLRDWQGRWFVLAPLPALLAAIGMPAGASLFLPDLLFGVTLLLDEVGRLFLGMTAAVWLAAGWHARATIRSHRFTGFWLLTLTGNLIVCVAADMASFYAGFAALSLAAWGLVVHSGSDFAARAARIYIRLAILGEAALVAAMMITAAQGGSILMAEAVPALATADGSNLAIALFLAGFGIKAGLMPLHVWLPLAHPAAPVPASAALSGAIVAAGILGLLRFLPLGEGLVAWGALFVTLGIATAFLGALFGMMQAGVKTALAYSTLSQMGLLAAAAGAALAGDAALAGPVAMAVALYSLHHGLAKAALFLAVEAVVSAPRLVLPLALVSALGVAGLPLTGGAIAKAAVKAEVHGAVATMFQLSAVTTTLLMLHAVVLLLARKGEGVAPRRPVVPMLLLALAAPLALWALAPDAGESVAPGKLFESLWPVALGAGLFLVARWRGWRWPARVPEGDLVVVAERAERRLWQAFRSA